MSIRKHVDRAYKQVFKKFNETAVYDPDDENVEIQVFPYTLDQEKMSAGAVMDEKMFMVRISDLPNPERSKQIEHLGDIWRINTFTREDVDHWVISCRKDERFDF